MRVGSVPLYFVYVRDHFYDCVIKMQKDSLTDEEREKLDEEQDGSFEVLSGARHHRSAPTSFRHSKRN